MKLNSPITISTDVLIIGGGGAGLRAAIEAKSRRADVLVVSRSRVGYGSNTTISGGAFTAAPGPSSKDTKSPDSWEQHLVDTVTGGYFLSDQELVDVMVRNAEQQVEDLRRFGVSYTNQQESPWMALSTDPGHSRLRMIYGQNAFGTDFTLPLRLYAINQGVEFLEGILITSLLHDGEKVVGAIGVNARGQVFVLAAPAVVLTSGGLGKIYSRTDNAAGSTGDGYAIAYDSGAVLKDMEFVQFYPVSSAAGTPALFYECFLLDTGGRLLNRIGEDIVTKYQLAEPMLLTRDRLSRAIALEVDKGLGFQDRVALDLTEIPESKMAILHPVLPKLALKGERRFLVTPTVHFHMGGVKINQRTETNVPGLYAAGEVCAGIHGANRLSGNALTEVWVFGTIAGREAAERLRTMARMSPPAGLVADTVSGLQELASRNGDEMPEVLYQSLKEVMWRKAGLIRDVESLKQAQEDIHNLRERFRRVQIPDGRGLQSAVQLRNMLTVSEMICRAANLRSESRGAHYRQDFPETDNNDWLCNIHLAKKDDIMELTTQPVSLTKLSPST